MKAIYIGRLTELSEFAKTEMAAWLFSEKIEHFPAPSGSVLYVFNDADHERVSLHVAKMQLVAARRTLKPLVARLAAELELGELAELHPLCEKVHELNLKAVAASQLVSDLEAKLKN